MKLGTSMRLLLALALGSTFVAAHAQSMDTPAAAPLERAQVRMETRDFLRTHRWDERASDWVPRNPAPPVFSGLTRAQVRADTIAFTRTHHWDEELQQWVLNLPIKGR